MSTSLLFVRNTEHKPRVSEEVFKHLHLNDLLSAQTLNVLALDATFEDLQLRRAVFQILKDAKTAELLDEFRKALYALGQALDQYRYAKNECERLLTFYSYLCNYKRMGQIAAQIRINDQTLFGFTEHLRALEPLTVRLETATKNLESDLNEIYKSRLIFNPVSVHLQNDTNETGMLEKLGFFAEKLDLCTIDLPAQRNLSMPHELSAVLIDLYPNQFAKIRRLEVEFAPILNSDYLNYREELNFYFSLLELYRQAEERNVPTCIPTISETPVFKAKNAYDITLLKKDSVDIVPNDIEFSTETPFFFLTGANGGGKTTYLRCVCANLLFANAGCPMFADSAETSVFSYVGIHFPGDETTSGGRLEEEQTRAKNLLNLAKGNGFLFFNETFSGANDKKGLVLTLDCAETCVANGIFALFVTHIHEVSGHGFPILSTEIESENNNRRTYKISRNTVLHASYAEDILRKYRLSYDTLPAREEQIK